MGNENKPFTAQAESIAKNTVEAGEKTSIQVLIGPDRAPNFSMRCFTIEPGGGMPDHTNAVEHEQYVLAGRAEVGIGEEVYTVNKGDVVFIPAGIPHWYKTKGDEAFMFLCVVPNQPDTIRFIKDS
ncbi:MAG TPA: cupin domain-containing protein [Deltaproteobacteria bacterium]|nr:cupin domain-containing protein [Deltaproteobacteria bacterium]